MYYYTHIHCFLDNLLLSFFFVCVLYYLFILCDFLCLCVCVYWFKVCGIKSSHSFGQLFVCVCVCMYGKDTIWTFPAIRQCHQPLDHIHIHANDLVMTLPEALTSCLDLWPQKALQSVYKLLLAVAVLYYLLTHVIGYTVCSVGVCVCVFVCVSINALGFYM